jgi:hypothetical protein
MPALGPQKIDSESASNRRSDSCRGLGHNTIGTGKAANSLNLDYFDPISQVYPSRFPMMA